ncbi:MAG: hypothetical protein ACHP7P_14735 [Terriglobales bacterium]
MRMLVASLGLGDHPEDELVARLDLDAVGEEDIAALSNHPETHVRLFESYGLGARLRPDGRVNLLKNCIDEGHGVVAFLGAKALRTRWHPWGMLPFGVVKAGYQPVVVTGVRGRRAVFHDPDPARGGANQSMRKGQHTVWSRRNTFAHVWGVWQGWLPVVGYFTLKMPGPSPAQRLPPWTFVETWLLS